MLEQLTLPVPVETTAGTVVLRRAEMTDLRVLMSLLADDPISATRGDVADLLDEPVYRDGLARTLANNSNEIVVAVDENGLVIGTLQLTLIPGLARRGSVRLLIEAVRVGSQNRSAGVGGALMRWVTETAAPELGATLVQLTSDAARVDAHRFYKRLGFTDSHIGFKYQL